MFLGCSMLKLTSRFVLQVLPYVLMALSAIVLLPGVADSLIAAALPNAATSPPQIEMTTEPFGQGQSTLDLIRQDHEAFAENYLLGEIAKVAETEIR